MTTAKPPARQRAVGALTSGSATAELPHQAGHDPKLRQQPQPATQEELLKSTRAVLRAIQRSPRRIQGYFKPPAVRYAA